MKYVLLLFLITASVSVCGQQKIIFKENFNNNRKKWKLYNDSDFVVKIDKGKLHIQKIEINRQRNSCLWYSKKIPKLNTLNDFTIIFSAKILSYGDILDEIDMQWGKLNECDTCNKIDSLYQVEFGSTRLRFSYFFNRHWTYFQWSGPYSNLFKSNGFNKYEIAQTGDSVIIKINNSEVYKAKLKRISGHNIGVQECLKNSWEVDKLLIKQ